jgi:hypothetical protein
MSANPVTLSDLQAAIVGTWTSLSVELRPTEDRLGTGQITPTFLRRRFTYAADGTFVGIITMYGDNYGDLPLLEFTFAGDLVWHEAHPIATGAYCVDYILNREFAVTPLNPMSADMLNANLLEGMEPFAVGTQTSILGKAFPMFNIVEGQVVGDYDLLYVHAGLLFMGAKHVNGTPFDKPENRPHQLQIPLERA